MNDDVRGTDAHGCEAYADDLSELALGVLTGRERVQALSHVETCPRCAEELEQLSRAADGVVQVAPEVEPPMGFEVRLFERMGVADEERRHRRRPPRWVPAALAAAAAVVALAVGLTLTLASPSPPPQNAAGTTHHHHDVVVASLLERGESVGHVVMHGGAQPWMSMMLADSGVRGTVDCVVVTNDGVTHWVGSFTARNGYGAWLAPLHVNPGDLRTAEVVSPSGTVIASASLA